GGAAQRVLTGGLHERVEQRLHGRVVVNQVFGVPLDAEREVLAGNFQRFDHAIGGVSGDFDPRRWLLYTLMVKAVHINCRSAENLREVAVALNLYRVSAVRMRD